MEIIWQVLPQVDTQALYSFVSSHERATQMKQSSHITSQKHKKESEIHFIPYTGHEQLSTFFFKSHTLQLAINKY